MANLNLYINEASLDSDGSVWVVGRGLSNYDGNQWNYYNSINSAVPSNASYFKDTRSISIDPQNNKWVGSAVTTGVDQNLVFYISGDDVNSGNSWGKSEFGDIISSESSWDVPSIYACPYGNDVLAFISPLNGGGGTGASGDIGVTGGYLWRYDKVDESWSEVAPGYTWPHIYEMTAVGTKGGDYDYYLCTDDGLQIIPDGKIATDDLEGGIISIPEMVKKNTSNSNIGSDVVYSISFDENGNYWLGTSDGLVYWDGEKYYRWSIGAGVGVTKVVSRKNGHVFFKIGSPNMVAVPNTDGFYHFNGTTFTNYTQSNSDLIDDRVIDLLVIQEKSQYTNKTAYSSDLWVVAGNYITLFDYTIPHVYGTSKYTGTTGWNFVSYTPTTEGGTTDTARLPKSNKYTWEFPTWTNRDLSPLLNNHPGMDPRNLFLETDFKDIANNSAGNRSYWSNPPVLSYTDVDRMKLIPDEYSWLDDIDSFTITSSCRYKGYNVVTGYSSESSINLGEPSNLESAYSLVNPNPSGGTGGTGEVGFVAFYSDAGQIMGAIPFRGKSTRALRACPSLDDSTLFVAGSFSNYIEAGKFVYGSKFPGASEMNATGVSGPTGAPIGFSNIATPGITASYDYPWILNGPTGATSGAYIPDESVLDGSSGYFIAEVDYDIGNQVSYGGIDFSQPNAIQSSYCLSNFRYFPRASYSYDVRPGSPTSSNDTSVGISDLSISKNSVRLTTNIEGGISTLSNGYGRTEDIPNSPYFLFSEFEGGSYYSNGFVIDMDSYLDLKNGFTLGSTGFHLKEIQSLRDSSTYVLSGSSSSSFSSGGVSLNHPGPTGVSRPFFLLNSSSNLGITGAFVRNFNSADPLYSDWSSTGLVYRSNSQYYFDFLYSGNATITPPPAGTNGIVTGTSGGVNLGTISLRPGGGYSLASSYNFLPSSYGEPYKVSLTQCSRVDSDGDYYVSLKYPQDPAIVGDSYNIVKRNVTGTFIDSFSTSQRSPESFKSDLFHIGGVDLPGSNQASVYNLIPFVDVLFINSIQEGADLTDQFNDFLIRNGRAEWTDIGGNSGYYDDPGVSLVSPGVYQFSVLSGGVVGTKPEDLILGEVSFKLTPSVGEQSDFTFTISGGNNMFLAGSHSGVTGPANLPYVSGDGNFTSMFKGYKKSPGKAMGDIISRVGSGSWSWVDVHNSNSDLYVPMLSTLFLSNYDSKIFGKNNNRWILTNAGTGEVLLDVKSVPYFIYTFAESGYYSIVNSVEDSAGNVYEVSKPAFVKVVNQSIPLANDPNPEYVNSADYGYIPANLDRNSKALELGRDMNLDQLEIMLNQRVKFGSGIVIPNNPDATFNQ